MEQKDYKYISVAYKLYDITDNKQELIEETAKDKPFVFLSGFGTTLEDFESNLVGLAGVPTSTSCSLPTELMASM